MSAPRISVITPTLNRHQDVPRYIESLRRQTVLPDELVLVDAGDSVEKIAREALSDSPMTLVYLRSERGTSVQRNVGLEVAGGEFIFFFDDDGVLRPDYIERSLEAFELDVQPPVGAVMGTMEGVELPNAPERAYRRLFRLGGYVEGEPPTLMSNGQVRWASAPDGIIRVPVVSGGRTAYRREALAEERFDDFLPGYTHGEDVELAIRVATAWTLLQTPHARMVHHYSPAGRRGEGDRVGRALYGAFFRYRKHLPNTPRSAASFGVAAVGLSLMHAVRGLKIGAPVDMVSGIAWGWKLCAADLAGRPPRGTSGL